MARNPEDIIEENSEQRDEDQAQDVGDEAVARRLNDAGELDRDPTVDTEHGGSVNPAAIIPEDTPDLVDTMNQMLTSGVIDNGAYAGEPMMDDEEDGLGQTDSDEDE
jgi:hypothetical protein